MSSQVEPRRSAAVRSAPALRPRRFTTDLCFATCTSVIVGAGSAGCVLAARLTEDADTSVLLIEAGPGDRKLHVRVPAAFSKLFRSPLDWGYDTVPQTSLDGRRLVFPRGKVVGGSASINAMMAIRGHRADHDAWPRGWGWEDVASAYERSDLHFPRAGQRRPSPLTFDFLASAAAAGIPPAPTSTARTTRAPASRRSRSGAGAGTASSTAISARRCDDRT